MIRAFHLSYSEAFLAHIHSSFLVYLPVEMLFTEITPPLSNGSIIMLQMSSILFLELFFCLEVFILHVLTFSCTY